MIPGSDSATDGASPPPSEKGLRGALKRKDYRAAAHMLVSLYAVEIGRFCVNSAGHDQDGDGVDDLVLAAPGDPPAMAADDPLPGRVYLLLSGPYTDGDGDGFDEAGGDCDDADAATYPGATEPCDGIDNDCDDTDAGIYPGQSEVPCDGVDNDCDPDTGDQPDADGDGFDVCPACDDHCTPDCDDTDPSIHPGMPEQCDGRDDNCDGWIDEGLACPQGCSCTDSGWAPSAAAIFVAPLVFTGRRLRRRRNGPHRS